MVITEEIQEKLEQFPNKYGGGPRGLGDPDDKSLRKVETEVLIPKIMRDRAKIEKCVPEVKAFEECCKNSSLLMVVKCREQNSLLQACIGSWYKNKDFINECTEMYLEERSEYRRTGLQRKYRNYIKEKQKQRDAQEAGNVQ